MNPQKVYLVENEYKVIIEEANLVVVIAFYKKHLLKNGKCFFIFSKLIIEL